jgi:hypothetical protein
LAPYIATYAKNPSTWPQLRRIFASNSGLEYAALDTLAGDEANADAAMAVADNQHLDPTAAWVPKLLGSLVAAGVYGKARAVWAKVSRVPIAPGQLLYDPGFTDRNSIPPFNWDLTSSAAGLAERQAGGRLHVIFYGQQDGMLARQLLQLAPGRYRLTMAASGDMVRGRSITWSVRCDRSVTPLGAVTLDVAVSRPWSFTVPSDCPAQWLQLSGVSSDVAQQADFTISGLELELERPNG